VRGSTVCTGTEFAAAVDIVRRHRDEVRRLISHEVAFEDAPEAIAHAQAHPADVMKLVIRKGEA
jgi:threonine dehydrogenase-like Zn-dependent dehydrogenase